MTVINRWSQKVILPRLGMDDFWRDVRLHYAGADAQKWKALAMLSLRVNANWSLDMLSETFGHEKGHISRTLTNLCRELKSQFEAAPDEEEIGGS